MLRTQTEALATNLKIPMENLKWFAAFHNESHHPHVHLIAYSSQEQEGYLSKKGVHNLRKSFANDIFAQDLLCLFKKQTEYRDELRKESRVRIEEIIAKLQDGKYDNPKVEELLLQLANRLSKTNRKKVYGYLKADVKAIVDSIVDELGQDDRVAELYNLWYEQKEKIKRTYTESIDPRIALSQNKEFKSIRNAIIQEAMHIVEDDYEVQDIMTPIMVITENTKIKKVTTKSKEKPSGAGGVINLMYHVSRIFQDKLAKGYPLERSVDRKLRRQIDEKKQAQGIKQ